MMSIARIGRSTRTRPPDASIRPPGHECPAPATDRLGGLIHEYIQVA
jgi:hypothetical protein